MSVLEVVSTRESARREGADRNDAGVRIYEAGRSNLRTALVLLSVAILFFAGVIVNRILFT